MNARIALCAGGVMLCAATGTIDVGPKKVAGQTDWSQTSRIQTNSAKSITTVIRREVPRRAQPSRQIADTKSTRPGLFKSWGRLSPLSIFKRSPKKSSRPVPVARRKPIRQVQHVPVRNSSARTYPTAPQESEVQRQLRLLYAKDGKQMPSMDIQNLPIVRKGAVGASNLRRSTSPPSRSPFRFLKRFLPFRSKSRSRRTPRYTNSPPRFKQPPQYRRPGYRQPGYRQPGYRQPGYRQPQPRTVSAPQPRNVKPNRYRSVPTRTGVSGTSVSRSRTLPIPRQPVAGNSATSRKPAGDDDIPVLIDDREEKRKTASQPKTITPVAPSTQVRKKPVGNPFNSVLNPFPNLSEAEADRRNAIKPNTIKKRTLAAKPVVKTVTKPTVDKSTVEKSTVDKSTVTKPKSSDGPFGKNPFTGRSLTADNHPLKKTQPAAAKKQIPQVSEAPARIHIKSFQQLRTEANKQRGPSAEPKTLKPQSSATPIVRSSALPAVPKLTREEKLRQIAQRRGMGFRGFCPVALRDQRGLADAKLQFQSSFEGKTYYFSSATAKTAFDRVPEKYAPASGGIDVITLEENSKVVKGSLEHAVWFRGRIYFFSGADTLRKFIEHPKKYAVTE